MQKKNLEEEKLPYVGEVVVEKFKKKITSFGHSGHILVSKDYVGEIAEIRIIKKWLICQRCSETISDEKQFSPDLLYCKACYEAVQFLKKNKNKLKCKKCGKKITEEEYSGAWDNEFCQDCCIKDMEEWSKKMNKGEKQK